MSDGKSGSGRLLACSGRPGWSWRAAGEEGRTQGYAWPLAAQLGLAAPASRTDRLWCWHCWSPSCCWRWRWSGPGHELGEGGNTATSFFSEMVLLKRKHGRLAAPRPLAAPQMPRSAPCAVLPDPPASSSHQVPPGPFLYRTNRRTPDALICRALCSLTVRNEAHSVSPHSGPLIFHPQTFHRASPGKEACKSPAPCPGEERAP